MSQTDRATSLWVSGLRSLADVHLPLSGLTVLIGENGSGKSSLIEALEILRKVSLPGSFLGSLARIHDLHSVVRDGGTLEIGARLEGGGAPVEYTFAIERRVDRFAIVSETLDVFERGDDEPLHAIVRDAAGCKYYDQKSKQLEPIGVSIDQLALRALLEEQGKRQQVAAARVDRALGSGEVHLPFEVRARWVCEERGWETPLRSPAVVERAAGVDRLGANIVNAYLELKNQPDWSDTLDDIRIGLGPEVRDVVMAAAARGQQELKLRYADMGIDVPASSLSDGTLSYLAFVALIHLGKDRTFLAIDEPESHLDPALLINVFHMLARLSESTPVLLATHSDRLLDALPDPAGSVVLCDLDGKRRTQLRRPSAETLKQWIQQYRYRGLGHLRAETPVTLVMGEPMAPHRGEKDKST